MRITEAARRATLMTEFLSVRVYGVPIPQGRPRARVLRLATGGVRASVYERAEDKDWKQTVLAQALEHRPLAPVEGPLAMTLSFLLPRPKSLPKRERHPIKKPDADNLCKAIKDALRGVMYRDDSQIVDLHVTKAYDLAPGVVIRVSRISQDAALVQRTP
ncbi:MAG TPA: RusA family crossover junction endodeoxyribonuclease [Dehalococcoidia bacterium]|jgi:Holliday junction resolvase RusA-like endonuclease|nr:RusA family crossover junction endodeoxyribonuclease [Dehalococcoidia bacterium]